MADDSGEKTEQPTDKKIRDSREKGQVAQSKELTGIAAMAVIIVTLVLSYNGNLKLFAQNSYGIYHDISINNLDFYVLNRWLHNSLSIATTVFLFPTILGALISLAVCIAQLKGIVLSKEAFKFDLKKLNPIDNFKSVFSLKNVVKFVRQIFEITIMAIIATFIFEKALVDILKIGYLPITDVAMLMSVLIGKIFTILFCIHLLFSITDFIMEKRHLNKELMMSMHDIKEEFKNTEGNPEIKQKRRELHRELLEDDGFGMMSNSTFVVANPTHIAIVIIYRPQRWPLPVVFGKARGEKALEVFHLAKKLQVPIIRDKWLARQLFEIGEINKHVPQSMLKYIADLIGKNLYQMPKLAKEIVEMQKNVTKPQPPVFKHNLGV